MTQLPNDGTGGTYACLYLTKNSANRLLNWSKKAGIYEHVLKQHKDGGFHITTAYSKLPVSYTAHGLLPPLPVKPKNFSVFGKDNNYLVLEVNSNFAANRNAYARLLGAVSDFPDYKPHVSLAKDSGITDPRDLPSIDFNLYLHREEVSRVDPDR
jgi:hypothetical protein